MDLELSAKFVGANLKEEVQPVRSYRFVNFATSYLSIFRITALVFVPCTCRPSYPAISLCS